LLFRNLIPELLMAAIGIATCAAQQPADSSPVRPEEQRSATMTLRVTTRLVVLDAVAIDAKGNVVTDLKKEDFHVLEQKRPQVLRSFYAPGTFNVKTDTEIHSTADLDRKAPQAPVNIVVLDEFNTRFEDMAFARYSLQKLLEAQPDNLATPTMLCAVTLDKFTVLKDYTRDKAVLLDALERHLAAYPWQLQHFSWIEERYAQAFVTLGQVAEASLGHPGHKNMIWIGRGLPTVEKSGFTLDDNISIRAMVQRTVNKLRDARVTLYTVDPAGLMVHPDKYGEENFLFAPWGGDPNFEKIALATGGRAMHGSNDVDAQIGTAMRDGASMYTLSYQPTQQVIDDTKFRSIQVTVDRPGVTVFTRAGYYLTLPPESVQSRADVQGSLEDQLLAASHSNISYDAVHFSVQSVAGDPLTLNIHLNPETVVWYYVPDGSKPRWMSALLLVSTFDKKNKPIQEKLMKLAVAAPAGVMQDGGKLLLPVDQEFKIEANPKVTRVRLVLRMQANGHMGTVDFESGKPVQVSNFGALTSPTATAQSRPEAAPSTP